MITDKLTSLATPSASVASGFSAGSFKWLDKTIDLGSVDPGDIGQAGRPAFLQVTAQTTVTAEGAGTLKLLLASDDTERAAGATASGGGTPSATYMIHAETQPMVTNVTATTSLKAGTVMWTIPLPVETDLTKYRRYLGLVCHTVDNAIDGGTISAKVTFGTPEHHAYPSGEPARAT